MAGSYRARPAVDTAAAPAFAIFHRRPPVDLVAAAGCSYSRLAGDAGGTASIMGEAGISGPFGFFIRRWRRQAPLALVFWRDMLFVGTAINFAAAFCGLMALGFKAELPVAMAIFFAPMPYNIFLVAAVWRTADRVEAARASFARFGAALWLVVTTII